MRARTECIPQHFTMSIANRQCQNFFIAVLTLMLCISLFSVYPKLLPLLMWNREAITTGEWWRLLSAHIVHVDSHHLLLNMIGLVLILASLCQSMTMRELVSLLLTCACGISYLLLYLQPDLHWYAGLSGVLHGVWAAAAAQCWIGLQKRLAMCAWFVLLVKLIFFNQGITDMPVVSVAHVYGAISGLAWACLWWVSERKSIFD